MGWRDGGILGLDLAIRHPDRGSKLFALAANTDPSGIVEGAAKESGLRHLYGPRRCEYEGLSATPKQYDAFVDAIGKMWATQPNFTLQQLKNISVPIQVVDGDHNEAIKWPHTEQIAAAIPRGGAADPAERASLLVPPRPEQFNADVHTTLNKRAA